MSQHKQTTELVALLNGKLDEKVKEMTEAEKRYSEQVLALQKEVRYSPRINYYSCYYLLLL